MYISAKLLMNLICKIYKFIYVFEWVKVIPEILMQTNENSPKGFVINYEKLELSQRKKALFNQSIN